MNSELPGLTKWRNSEGIVVVVRQVARIEAAMKFAQLVALHGTRYFQDISAELRKTSGKD